MKAGADSVMVTHVIYNKIDPEYPASLSPKINSLIRNNCNYNGVIVTDALEMGAITDFAKEHGNASVDVLAVKAGNDMIMTTDYATGIKEIVSAVKAGEIPESQINASVTRILQLKNKLGLLKPENLMFRKPTNNNNTSTVINPGNTDHKNPSVISENNSITISGVTYNNDKKVAFINGKVSDPAAEGSMIMTATNANTGKKITTAVVGGKGVFAIELPMTNEVQNVKITSDDDSYAAVTTKVEAIKADKPVVNTDQNNKQNSSTEKQTNKQNNSVKDEVNITLNTEKQANSAKKNTQVVSKNINSEKTTVTNPVYKSAIKTNYQGKNVITISHNSAAHAVAQKSNNNAKVLPKTGTKENIVALFGLAITSTTALFGLALRKKN
ncbi:LPXTG cell wall anchor domain-containing protein [Lactobacillus gasseri]